MLFEKKVKNFVLLSTDKAVYPINAMGLSKALAEKIVIAKSRTLKNSKLNLLLLDMVMLLDLEVL
jgi:UDP-N-acetylglucosamine 4,6-dehydratase